MMPVRIQRKRTKGWRMPDGAVYVGRPTMWGNPYVVGEALWWGESADAEDVVEMFHHDMDLAQTFEPDWFEAWIAPLRGGDLACWCKVGTPCHADVLLELANSGPVLSVKPLEGE